MALKGPTSRMFLFSTFFVLDLSLLLQLIIFPATGQTRGRYITRAEAPLVGGQHDTEVVQSVYVEEFFHLNVVQQPKGNANYVSPNRGEVTQFSTVTHYGNVGLLAHNYLSGREFSDLSLGQEVLLLYKSGKTEHFVITEILRYQALRPKSPFSSFQNLNNKNEVLSATEMFERAYAGDYHITFQTCIAKNGISSWGRLFIVAVPKSERHTLGFHSQPNQFSVLSSIP